MIASLRFAVAGALGAVCALPLAAQRHVPATYAITGARIVPVSGPVIEKGTIVIRDGVIAAVGASVATPGDARIVDGSGLTVYPGLIDAYGSLGMGGAAAATANAATAGRGGRGGAATPTRGEASPNSTYATGLRPEINVVDELDGVDGEFDAAHGAGFTAALTAVNQGIFRGQAAIINLSDDSAAAIVIKSGVAQSIGFARGGGRGGYPGSLMGAFAALRQEFFDAQHYRDVNAAYAKNPRGGMRRPAYDASLEALQPVISGKQFAIMQASSEREIIRALDLAKEFGLKAVIAGGAEAYKVAARLKAENVPVLLTLNFPRPGAAGAAGGGFGGGRGGAADPADPEPLRMLRDRVMAPKGPKMLADMGVKFAFQSGGGYPEMLANLRKAITAGLPADQAIRALTVQPAELFGVSDRMGTIEAGKVANLTITRGELTDSSARVTQLFIDGKPIMIAAAPAAANGGGRGARPGGGFSASGTWVATIAMDGRDHSVTLHIWQDGERLTGELQGDLGAVQLTDGTVSADGSFSFFAQLNLRGGTVDAEFNGTVDRNGLHAQVEAEGHKAGSLSAAHSN